jgi:predicted branched-subunit amino acid permease
MVNTEQLAVVEQRIANENKSTGLAYVLWLFTGVLGIHNFYVGRPGLGAAEPLLFVVGIAASINGSFVGPVCLGLCGLLLFFDLFTLPGAIGRHREQLRKQYIAEFAAQPPPT